MSECLRSISSPLTIHQVYGLFHGCLAAPRLVGPSEYMSWIVSEEEPFESLEDANEFLANLMGLWSHLASCKADEHPVRLPALEPPVTEEDLKSYVQHRTALVTYFTKGLDLGGTHESDFTLDGLQALGDLAHLTVFLDAYLKVQQKGPPSSDEIRTAYESIRKAEPIIGDCIARINMGLKAARKRVLKDLARSEGEVPPLRSLKIGRNDPCPCGSGKKYKHCCGIRH